MDSIDATIYVADMETYEIIFMNRHMIDAFGADLTGQICYKVFRGETSPCGHCTNEKLRDTDGNPTGVHVWESNNPITGKWYINHDRAIQWVDGRMVRLQIASDISKLKELEQERIQTEEQLRQAQKMESVGRLAGGIAHDFNNMLGVIIGHAEMMFMDIKPGEPHYEDLQEIHKAAKRSADLTRQLLAFARKQSAAPKVLDLNDTVEGMLKMLHRLIGENIELEWKPDNQLGPVKIDPAQVDQILANLCVNARDAISGTGKITIKTEDVVLSQTYCAIHAGLEPGRYAILTVSDDGYGMDKEILSRVFEPFFTTKEVGEGTGLGLATVYGIVKQNNALIKAHSEPGHGTTFKIYLPRVQESVETNNELVSKTITNGNETVLLVEDEEAILSLGREILERFGYRVLTARTPGEAIALTEQYKSTIHLLATDVVMPEMNGKKLMERIVELRPHIKVLFISAYPYDVITKQGSLDSDIHFLQKPFSVNALSTKVREVLDMQG
jgi:signal transduction histidine kinase